MVEQLHEYTLDAKTLARYKRREITNCPRCGEEFKVGQRVISRSRYLANPSHNVLYHKKCYEKMYYP